MKKYMLEFLKRGLMCAACGPVILAIIYAILAAGEHPPMLTCREVSLAVITLTIMAFIAAGITVVYHIDRLPLVTAIGIHAGVLYADYLLIYLINRWIPRDLTDIGVFTAIFLAGYAAVWLVIYLSIRRKTDAINKKLQKQ